MIRTLVSAFSTFKHVLYESAPNALITMNSPKNLNSLTADMKADLLAALDLAEKSPQTRAITLLSASPKAFCAGANIHDFTNKLSKDFLINDIFEELAYKFANSKKPIIAAVNGLALGGGFELSLLCDIILCQEATQFGFPQIKLGLIPGIGGTQRFPKIVGKSNAMRYTLTGQFFKSDKAKQMGVVSEVYANNEQLKKGAVELGNKIAKNSLPSLIAGKSAIKLSEELGVSAGVAQERKLFYPLFDSKGTKEGIQAFVEKRQPKFDDQ